MANEGINQLKPYIDKLVMIQENRIQQLQGLLVQLRDTNEYQRGQSSSPKDEENI